MKLGDGLWVFVRWPATLRSLLASGRGDGASTAQAVEGASPVSIAAQDADPWDGMHPLPERAPVPVRRRDEQTPGSFGANWLSGCEACLQRGIVLEVVGLWT